MSPRWTERLAYDLKRAVAGVVLLVAIVMAASILRGDGAKTSERWTFLDAATPAELGLVADGSGGAWALEDHEHATGGRALANHEGAPGEDPAVLVAMQPRARDVRARTRCKVVSTAMPPESFAPTPAACGVVFRFVDRQNHWVVRANVRSAVEMVGAEPREIGGVVEAATVVRGVERVLEQALVTSLAVGSWIDLEVEARGDIVRVALDGRHLLAVHAPAVMAAFGSAGLWAPSEATVFFDHFAIETLAPAPQAVEILPILGRRQG